MGGATWAFVAVAVAFVVVAAACQRQGEAPPPHVNPALATLPAQTTTTNPYSPVPLVIDAEYVDRVLAGLDQALGDTLRIVVQARNIPQEVIDRVRNIHSGQRIVQLQLTGYQTALERGLRDFKPVPGNQQTLVAELLTVKRDCVYARVKRDYTAMSTHADPRFDTQGVAIRRRAEVDPLRYNPTPWELIYDGFTPQFTAPPEDPCGS